MKTLWKLLTIYDKVLIISLVLISTIAIFIPVTDLLARDNSEQLNKIIVIQSETSGLQKIPAENSFKEQPLLIKVEGPIGISIIEVHNGKVRLKKAPPADPGKICEKTGWISQPGPVIVCVPNKISIWIEARESNLDGVSW